MRCHGNLGHPDPNSGLQAEPERFSSLATHYTSLTLYMVVWDREDGTGWGLSPSCFTAMGKHILICVFVSFIHSFNTFLLSACFLCACGVFWVSQSLAL